MTEKAHIIADAAVLQERDEFRADGWLKVLAPAKVNLHLAIGELCSDGYHAAETVMHALALHDVVYLRLSSEPKVRMVAGDSSIELPDLAPEDNIAMRAVSRLAEALGESIGETPGETFPPIEMRIEKNIPAQAGLGGGSSDAAAALVGAARLWGIADNHPAIEQVARGLGADVAFFLHGGCAYLEGTGDEFVHALEPAKTAVALVKPAGGVSTAQAYRTFDDSPTYVAPDQAAQVKAAQTAHEVDLFNNLASASEALMPELAQVRAWLESQPQVKAALLSGSGAATFALCDTLADATQVATAARVHGWWSRATALSSLRAVAAPGVSA